MAPFRLDAIARRHQVAPNVRAARRATPRFPGRGAADTPANHLFRGLLYGVPIGLAMWLMLGALFWRIA